MTGPFASRRQLWRRRRIWVQRGAVLVLWMTGFATWRWYQTSNDLGTTEAAQRFIDGVEMVWWGLAAYVGVYLLRPLVLFPASVLTIVGGVLFGPAVGIAVVVVAANSSATIAYLVGRSLGRSPDKPGAPESVSIIERWTATFRDNSFEAVLVMRLLFLPYDLVNFAAGALRIRWVPFVSATALGSLPGTVSFVLLGASLDRVDQGLAGLNRRALVVGVVILAASLMLARVVRARHADTLIEHPETQRAAS